MNYTNAQVRRQDRLLGEPEARELLRTGEYGVLSLQAETGGAYGVPLSFAWDGQTAIYLHCALEGRKLRCLSACERVSFCVVGRTRVVSDKFTTAYESVILDCMARTGLPQDERMRALELLLAKYSPNEKESGLKYAQSSLPRTEIVRLDIATWTGKCRSAD